MSLAKESGEGVSKDESKFRKHRAMWFIARARTAPVWAKKKAIEVKSGERVSTSVHDSVSETHILRGVE